MYVQVGLWSAAMAPLNGLIYLLATGIIGFSTASAGVPMGAAFILGAVTTIPIFISSATIEAIWKRTLAWDPVRERPEQFYGMLVAQVAMTAFIILGSSLAAVYMWGAPFILGTTLLLTAVAGASLLVDGCLLSLDRYVMKIF